MKKEFVLKTKIGQIVNHIEINILAKGSHETSLYKNGVHINPYKIVFQTNYKIALSNEWITILDRQHKGSRKDSFYHYLNEVDVYVRTKETYWPNGIFASCYTIEPIDKCIKSMVKAIKLKISEYSFLFDMNVDEVIDSYLNQVQNNV